MRDAAGFADNYLKKSYKVKTAATILISGHKKSPDKFMESFIPEKEIY